MKHTIRLFLGLVAVSTISACGAAGRSAQSVAASAVQNLGCQTATSKMWDSLQNLAEAGADYPTASEIRTALLKAGSLEGRTDAAFARYVDAFAANYAVTIEGVRENFGPTNVSMWRKALAEMEVGIRITDTHAALSDRIDTSLKTLARAEKDLGATCTQPETAGPVITDEPSVLPNEQTHTANFSTVWEQLKATQPKEIYGARRILATAYQSCEVLALAPMTVNTPSVEGIGRDSKPNPQNGGILRHYASLATIDATHYYIHNQQLAGSSCAEVRQHPPIYDFGGKPYTSSKDTQLLDMFRGDGGTGSEVYGLDCSGFVFSSLAVAGLRMIDPGPGPLKASMVLGTPAAAFKEPQSNHLTCLEKISVTKDNTVRAGDVVATKGHIIMIDSVGADPFGLNKITTAEGCGKLSYTGFDFNIAQSSPSKGSIGINRYKVKDYLPDSTTMRLGLTAYAMAACRAKFGLAANLKSPDLSIVRHKRTPECLIPALKLAGESCVSSCKPL